MHLSCKNTQERKFASTGDRTHNHQVMSPTLSPLSHPGKKFARKFLRLAFSPFITKFLKVLFNKVEQPICTVNSMQDLTTGVLLIGILYKNICFQSGDGSNCYKIHSSLTADHSLKDG